MKKIKNAGSNLPNVTAPPHDYYQSTWDWLVHAGLKDSPFHYKEFNFDNNEPFYADPLGLEDSVHWRFIAEKQQEPPPTFVAVIPNGRVWGAKGAVITPDNKLLWDISMPYATYKKMRPLLRKKKMPPLWQTAGKIAVLAFRFSHIYYHWMFDVLPKLYLLRSSNSLFDKLIFNYNGSRSLPFQEHTLAVLGVTAENIIACHRRFHLQASQLLVPSTVGYACSMPKWACIFLRKEFLPAHKSSGSTGTERIYISREHARFRKVLNEDQVISLLSRYGFSKVVLESLPFAEQVRLFSEAEIVVSAHGSGLANLVFCNQGTKVLELFPARYVHVVYWVLSNHVNLKYYYLIGEGERSPAYVHTHFVQDDIMVDLAQLSEILQLMKV